MTDDIEAAARAEFEKWARREHVSLSYDMENVGPKVGHYTTQFTQGAYVGWFAALAHATRGEGEEPFAWAVVASNGETSRAGLWNEWKSARQECDRKNAPDSPWGCGPYRVVPLYASPIPTPATVDGDRIDEAHRALGKPGRVDDDGCCVGCGRSVQPSPCCPDYPVWPGPCRMCYADEPPATGMKCWRDVEGTLPARRDGDKVARVDTEPPATGEAWPYECPRCGDRFKTDPRDMKHGDPGHLRSGLYCPGPVSATGEAGTRGEDEILADERERCAKAVECIDELAVSADWDNSDDIAHEVKKASAAAIRALAPRDGGRGEPNG